MLTCAPLPSACDCDPEGSAAAQCQEDGRCQCRGGFVGSRCDMCEENFFYNRSAPGCQQCPSCYSLVRDKVRRGSGGGGWGQRLGSIGCSRTRSLLR